MRRLIPILALAALLPSAAQAFTVSGRFLYEDRRWNGNGYTGTVQNLPIRHAKVEIVNVAGLLVLATGATDANGNYSINVTGQTLPVSFYARCLTDGRPGYQIWVVDAPQRDLMGGWIPPNAPVHAITTSPVLAHSPAANHSFGDFLIQDTDGTGVAQAFNIFDCAVDYFDWLSQPGLLGRLPNASEYVTYSWGPLNPNEGSNYTQHTILLSSPAQNTDTDGWSDTVIMHETGHWYDDVFSRSDNPGGAHFIGDNDANVLLAYGEGSATYHCAKVREWRAQTHGTDDLVSLYGDLMIPPAVGTPGGLSFSYDFETGNFGDTGAPIGQIGSANETNVTSALWDLIDGPTTPDATPGVDDDIVDVGADKAWAIEHGYMTGMPAANPLTVEDYWQGWFALNGPNYLKPGLEQVFVTLAKMPFRTDALEPDNSLATAGSITPVAHAVVPGGKVVINELNLGALDAVELYNRGDTDVDLTGWQIEVYQNDIAPGDPPTIYTFMPATLAPGETITLHEAGSQVDNGPYHVYAGSQQTFNAPWNNGLDGAVVLRNASQQAVDFVKWRAADGTPNNTPVPAGVSFSGNLDTPPAPMTMARDVSGTDTDAAGDFSAHYGSLGSANHPSPQYHTLFDVGDQDLIAFQATAGTRYGFETKGPYSKSDPRIELLTSSGTVIGSNDNLQSPVRDARLDYYATSSGTNYLRVTHVGTQTDYAEYQLLAFVRPPSSALQAPAGLSASAAHATDTQDEVSLQWVNASLYDTVHVYRDGTLIAALAGGTGQFTDHANRGLYRYEVSGERGTAETSRAGAYAFAGLIGCYATDDFEAGNANLWIREESEPGSRWDVTPLAQGGTWGFSDSPPGVPYRGCPAGETGCKVNAIAVLSVPAHLPANSLLEWDQICITEATFDFCIVEISTDGGTSWTELGRYDQSSDPAWGDNVADPTDWRHQSISLAAYAGQTANIRFRLESDSNIEFDGWSVDNVELNDQNCTALAVGDLARGNVLEFLPPSPNPMRGPARFAFILPSAEQRVDLAIYDVTGRVVRYERMGARPAGQHSWVWDGRDSRGQTVASGAYFAKLLAGTRSTTRKLLKLAP